MRHWSVDVEELKKDPHAYAVWELEQAVNFGIKEGKIKKSALAAHWSQLNLDPHKRKFLELVFNA